jgi:hypothetical protein
LKNLSLLLPRDPSIQAIQHLQLSVEHFNPWQMDPRLSSVLQWVAEDHLQFQRTFALIVDFLDSATGFVEHSELGQVGVG